MVLLCPADRVVSRDLTLVTLVEDFTTLRTTMPPKGTKYTTMTDKQRRELCRKKQGDPSLTLADLASWMKSSHGLDISISAIHGTLKRSKELLANDVQLNPDAKRRKTGQHPDVRGDSVASDIVSCTGRANDGGSGTVLDASGTRRA